MKNNFISSVWDFSEISTKERNYATHDFLRWYGKLVPQLVSRLINLYSVEGETVLANFAGSGTVLLEANILKRKAIGVDSNPLSLLLSSVKTKPFKVASTKKLQNIVAKLRKDKKIYPMNDAEKKWFYKESFQSLCLLKEAIESLPAKKERDFYLLALAAIVKKCSKVDARSVNHIVLDSKKPQIDVFNTFNKKVEEMTVSMQDYLTIAGKNQPIITIGDARNLNFPTDSVDLIISHPPYLGAIDYSNIYRLETNLLNFDNAEVSEADISTNSMKKYLSDMYKVFDEMNRVIKKTRHICVVIGDNRKDGNIQPTFSYFIQYATEKLGLELKDIFIWVTSQKAGMNVKRHGNHIDHNYILVFQKPS